MWFRGHDSIATLRAAALRNNEDGLIDPMQGKTGSYEDNWTEKNGVAGYTLIF
jgi:hypothetical protein